MAELTGDYDNPGVDQSLWDDPTLTTYDYSAEMDPNNTVIDYSNDPNYTQNEFFHYLGGGSEEAYAQLGTLFTESGASAWSSKDGLLDKAITAELIGSKDKDSDGSVMQSVFKSVKEWWSGTPMLDKNGKPVTNPVTGKQVMEGGLDGSEKALLGGAALQGLAGMLNYGDKKKTADAQAKESSAKAAAYAANTEMEQQKMANQAGLGNMQWKKPGLINAPQYQQLAGINRARTGA